MDFKAGGIWKEGVPYFKVSNVWREGVESCVKVNGVWRCQAYAEPLIATISSTYTYNEAYVDQYIFTSKVESTASGGTEPYTRLWQLVSGVSHYEFGGNNRPALQLAVIRTYASSTESVYRCKITDASGNVAYTPNVTIEMCWKPTGGGGGGGGDPDF